MQTGPTGAGGAAAPDPVTAPDPSELTDLRQAPADVRAAVLALNAAHEVETAPLDAAGLKRLLARVCCAPVRADGRAFLLACAADAAHDSANFAWFRARLPAFLYVDRIVVAPELRGTGLAEALYRRAFDHAAARGWPVVCEVNTVPPNPRSAAFHARLGFAPMGQGSAAPGKTVSYLIRR